MGVWERDNSELCSQLPWPERQHNSRAVGPAPVLIGAVATVFVSLFVVQKTTQANTAGCAVTTQFTISDAQVNSTGAVRGKLSNSGQGTVSNFTIEVTLTNGTIERKLA